MSATAIPSPTRPAARPTEFRYQMRRLGALLLIAAALIGVANLIGLTDLPDTAPPAAQSFDQ